MVTDSRQMPSVNLSSLLTMMLAYGVSDDLIDMSTCAHALTQCSRSAQ
jgi:hypothetical protein